MRPPLTWPTAWKPRCTNHFFAAKCVAATLISRIEQRALVSFETVAPVRLVDLRGREERFPVLQSMRYETSQAFAQACRQQGLHGVIYASAQHPSHSCVCLFKAGIERTRR